MSKGLFFLRCGAIGPQWSRQALFSIIGIRLFFFNISYATTWVIPPSGDIIGETEYVYPAAGETLVDVGLRYDMGYHEMTRANPNIAPNTPLSPNVRLLIPSQYKLPPVSRRGVVINLAEFRLYFFPEHDNVVMTYPVGIGRKGWSTPLGVTKIIAKERNPSWRPTANVLKHAAKKGVLLPDAFPAGPHSPLGKHAFRLGWPSYLIHGTNNPNGVGERVSAGCIRMLPDDIEYLFDLVPLGTSVRIVNIKY